MIVSRIVCEINEQSTAEAVAQNVINKVCREHQDQYNESNGKICKEREDMTLLVRLFSANLRKKSTPVTPPILISDRTARSGNKKSPDVMPVSIPYDEKPKKSDAILRLPKLVIPTPKLPYLPQSSSQPNSRVSTPVSLIKTSSTPPVAFYRNLSQVSEGSRTSTPTSPTNSASTTSSLAMQSPATEVFSTPTRSMSPWAETVQMKHSPLTVELGESQMVDMEDALAIAEKAPDTLKVESLEDSDGSEEEASQPEVQHANSTEAPVGDNKVDPYVDFTEFIRKINEAGGEEVVFKEFMQH